jgi:nitroreductase
VTPAADARARSLAIDEAISTRRSARAFLATPVPRATVEAILSVSSRAPSGTNTQPWKVHVLLGGALQRFTATLVDAYLEHSDEVDYEWAYYPSPFPEPYLSRRRRVGWDLYGLLGIEKGQTERMRAQHARNFRFFDAPVGMIFTIDRALEVGSWLDYGMFLQNIMIAARGRGLHTCPQAAFAPYHRVIRAELGVPQAEMVVCGMALGHIDESAPENALATERAPLGEFVRFHEP